MLWALGIWGQRMCVHSETQRHPGSALIHAETAGIGAALVHEALGKEAVREEAASGKEKKKKEKNKQAEKRFLKESLSVQGGMVRGAHNSGVLGHPFLLLGSLWPIPFSPVVRGQHCGLAVLADGSHWQLVNAVLCLVLIDEVVFLSYFL